MKKINISTKKFPNTFAMVDDADFDWLNQWKWTAFSGTKCRTVYAVRWLSSRRPGRKLAWMHRIILGIPSNECCDHVDGNGLNNQRSNLRIVSFGQNARNRRIPNNNKSGVMGVYWHSQSKKWTAHITHMGKAITIGRFLDKSEAVSARKSAEKKYFGNYVRLNQPIHVEVE